jgi:hypothetical protein
VRVIWEQRRGRASATTLWHCVKAAVGSVWLSWLFEPRDLWVGVHWNRPENVAWHTRIDVYVCVIPMLPLKIAFRRGSREQIRGNFNRFVKEQRYKIECRIYGEDATFARWYA